MSDNNNGYTMLNKLTVAKTAIETGIPALEKLGNRFLEVLEKSDANLTAVVQTRYAVLKDGNEANISAMLNNEKEMGLKALDILNGISLKAMSLLEMSAMADAASSADGLKVREMELELEAKKLELEAKKLELEAKKHELELREQTLCEERFEAEQAKKSHKKTGPNGIHVHG